jgi:hypothetical protein
VPWWQKVQKNLIFFVTVQPPTNVAGPGYSNARFVLQMAQFVPRRDDASADTFSKRIQRQSKSSGYKRKFG